MKEANSVKKKILITTMIVITVIIGGSIFYKLNAQENETKNLAKNACAAQLDIPAISSEDLPPLVDAVNSDNTKQQIKSNKNLQLNSMLDKTLPDLDGQYSAYVYCFKDGAEYIYNEKPMLSASMIKMFILAKAYEEINKGNLAESEIIKLKGSDIVGGAGNIQGMNVGTPLSVQYLLRQMIIESDNVATNIMIDRLGMAAINKYIIKNGYHNTKLQRHMMDFEAQKQGLRNYTSVMDLGKIFKLLYNHKCVNDFFDDKMISILKDQTDNDKIPQGLPGGTVIAHKTGELPGVFNDGGIVYSTKGDYIIVILANDVGQEAISNIASLSEKVYGLI